MIEKLKKASSFFVVMFLVLGVKSVAFGNVSELVLNDIDSVKVMDTTAYLSGYTLFTDPMEEYEKITFEYSTSNSFYKAQKKEFSVAKTNMFNVMIEDLTPNTKYYARIQMKVIKDNKMVEYYSTTKSFYTTNHNKYPLPKTYTAELRDKTIALDGVIEEPKNIAEVGFVYSLTKEFPVVEDNKIVSELNGEVFSGSIVVDRKEKKYYVRAYAIDKDKNIGYGLVKEVELIDKAILVKTNAVTKIDKTKATVEIEVTDNVKESVTKRGIVYSMYNPSPKLADKNDVTTNLEVFGTIGKSSIELIGLRPDTQYYVCTYFLTSNSKYYGDVLTFRTLKSDSNEKVQNTPQTQNPIKKTVKEQPKIPANKLKGSKVLFMPMRFNDKFEPDKGATRGEVAQILFNLSDDKTYKVVKEYKDVSTNYGSETTSKKAIDFVTFKKFMGGLPNGNFAPDATLTRAEVATVLANFYGLSDQASSSGDSFSDIKGHWGEKFVKLASTNKMINGFPNGAFGPDLICTRAQLCQIFFNAEERPYVVKNENKYDDVLKDHWAFEAIMSCSYFGEN